MLCPFYSFFFFFNATATTEIYTLSLHDALPISTVVVTGVGINSSYAFEVTFVSEGVKLLTSRFTSTILDRKSTRLNSSHEWISYAVFCLKKKKKEKVKN